jgi:hypothetical protein
MILRRLFVIFSVLILTIFSIPTFSKDNTVEYEFGSKKDEECTNRALKSARLIPHLQNGEITGLKISQIAASSNWRKRGFQNDDVIDSIENVPVRDAFASLLAATAVCKNRGTVVVIRNGKKFSLTPPQ